MRKHLAIMSKPVIEAIFAGHKTIESRFSQHKISPFGQVESGDLVYMKPPGGEVIGQFKIKKVIFFDGLKPFDIDKIFNEYGPQIFWGNPEEEKSYQKEKQDCSYGTLIFISESERFITSPIKIKKIDRRGWMVLK